MRQFMVDDILRLTKLSAGAYDRFTFAEIKAEVEEHLAEFIEGTRLVIAEKPPFFTEHMNLLTQTRIPLQQLQNGQVVQVCCVNACEVFALVFVAG
jgi:hypothetical protein